MKLNEVLEDNAKDENLPFPLSEDISLSLESLRSPSQNLLCEVGLFSRESLSEIHVTSSSSDGTMSERRASVCILKSKEFCLEK